MKRTRKLSSLGGGSPRRFRRILGGIMALITAAGLCAQPALALPADTEYSTAEEQSAEDTIEDTADDTASEQPSALSSGKVYLQSGMRAVVIEYGTDFGEADSENAEGSAVTAQELSELCSEIIGYGMNAVIINPVCGDELCYTLDSDDRSDALSIAVDAAHDAGLYTYVELDADKLAQSVAAEGGGLKAGFSAAVHRFAAKYSCEGIIVTDYYTQDTPEMYAEYMSCGSGIGYTNWLYETNEYLFRTVSEVIRRTDNSTAVGMLVSDMWANYTTMEDGSVTADSVEALVDGFCDTKGYVEKGYADFVLVMAYGSTSDSALNFESVVDWWYSLTESVGASTYVMHLNDRIGEYSGWYEDQLLRQLAVLEDYDNIGGSAFSSLSSLRANPLGTTDTLIKYFDEQINTDTIFDDLTMISPSSLSYVTYDNTVKFMGTFDENFDVLFDGEKITLNEAGNFYFQKELQVGTNTFVIEHKGKQYRYTIERRVDVLKSIESDKDVIVDGGTKISLVAVAYSGAKVTATIGGTTVTLKERSGSTEELDANGSYVKFVGSYTVGDGIIGEEQYLGSISYYASYGGYEEYMTGGSVTIEAEPEPVYEEIKVEMPADQSSVGSGEVVGTIAPVVSSSESVTYVRTISDYTIVYDAKTTGAIPSPTFSQLPAGTLDYYRSSSGGYVTTTSGKRFDAEDVTTFTDTGLGYNSLVVKSVGNSGGKSFIKLSLDYKISFNITTPVSYHEELDGSYGVDSYDASVVYITFDNVTSVTGLPSFSYCSLFSAGKWETVEENGVPKFRLELTLRQAGIYSGCSAYYDDNGDLMLTFDVPTATLSGKVIVIDPGHGYGKTADKLDPGAIGNVTEQSVNLAVAKQLEEKLTAMGATVVRLKTESEFILTSTRPAVARSYGADMYISLHCNSASNTEAHGVEVYYFTSFSQPLASAINDSLSSYYDNTVYADGTSSSRGAKYSYYWVTLQQDFPSVLVEMGFISNERECMVMADSTYQSGMAQAIADGVYAYFARSGLTYSASGSDDIPDTYTSDSSAVTETEDTSAETSEAGETTAAETAESVQTEESEDETEEEAPHHSGGIRVE